MSASGELLSARNVVLHRARWVGAGLAVGGVADALDVGTLGRGLLLAVPVFALLGVLGLFVGEWVGAPPSFGNAAASLPAGELRRYLPPALGVAVGSSTVALGLSLLAATGTAGVDDLGRVGRGLVRQCGPGQTVGAGPWPGSFYSAPLATVVLIGLLAAAATMRRVVLRPAQGGSASFWRLDDDSRAADDLLRRRSATVLVGACGALVTVPLIAISAVTAGALLDIGCRPTSWAVAGWVLVALVPVWFALCTVSVAAMLGLIGPRSGALAPFMPRSGPRSH